MFAEGSEVTVTGIVAADPLLAAPLTGEPCVLHWTHARVYDALDFAGNLVQQLVLARNAPFALHGEGEPIIVAADTMFELAIEPSDVWPHAEHAARLLGRYARYVRSTFFDHVVIRPGERVTVTGVVARDVATGGEHGYRETAVVNRLVGYAGRPLRITR